jgi:hypothetical protein
MKGYVCRYSTASVNACNAVAVMLISAPPKSAITSRGLLTGSATGAPLSMTPYVANASVVAGV